MGGEKWYLATLYILQREEILLISEYHCNQPPISSPFPRNLVLFMHFTSAFLKFQDIHERNKKLSKLSVYCLIMSSLGQVHSVSPFPTNFYVYYRDETGWQQRWHDIQNKVYTFFLWYTQTKQTTEPIIQSYWGAWHWS